MKKLIIITSILICIVLYFLEQIFEVNYMVKTGAKWGLFLIIPFLLDEWIDKREIEKHFHKRGLIYGLLFGLGSFLIVLGAYILLQDFINFPMIVNELESKSITAANFIFIAAYITFGNSLLEEFFFRGFIFLNLKHLGSEKLGYLFSASLFAIYHIAIFQSWFSIPLTILALFGLFTIGIIFNWLNTKTNTFINSWIVHIMADLAIIIIGFKLFGYI